MKTSMNETELDAAFIETVEFSNHVSGAIFFLVNLLVFVIIAFDRDERGIVYRKYLLTLQFLSILVDLLFTLYTPILLVNCRLAFSQSLLAQYINFASFATFEIFLFEGVINAYFACVYYRRNVVLPPGTRFCFVGWRRLLLFLVLQTVACTLAIVAYAILTTKYTIPNYLSWIINKPAYAFVHNSPQINVVAIVAVAWGLCMFIAIGAMIGHVLMYLNKEVPSASVSTKKYQKRAVIALVFQGTIPTCFYVGPVLIESVLFLSTQSMGLQGAASQRMVSSASAVVFSVITLHTVAHSLTILVFSPGYQKNIRDIPHLITEQIRRRISRSIEPTATK